MDTKLIATIGIIAVIGVAVCGLTIIKGKDTGYASDYTLLDSDDNVGPGLVITKEVSKGNDYRYTLTSSVNGRHADGRVVYTSEYSAEAQDSDSFDNYAPNKAGVAWIDYTSSDLPEGITVTVSGNVYTINGKYVKGGQGSTATYTFKDLAINYRQSSVQSVQGKLVTESVRADYEESEEYEIKTQASKVIVHVNVKQKETDDTFVDKYYAVFFDHFDKTPYKGASIVVSEEQYGNITATVYTVNGTSDKDVTYDDYRIYTYDGLIIGIRGLADGEKYLLKTEIYVK